jgi:RNA polymerase sigma-70 factor, ECF subfamily
MNSTPDDLVAQAQHGSREAIGALYDLFHQKIYRYLYYRTSDRQTAEDLTADVFLKMVQALPAYRPGPTPFLAWLFQIARNLVIDHYRRMNSHSVVAIPENMDSKDRVENTMDKRLTSGSLALALADLDDLQRDVLLLRFFEGMPILEVARTLHKSVDAVKGLQRRGLTALRGKIDLLEEKQDGS